MKKKEWMFKSLQVCIMIIIILFVLLTRVSATSKINPNDFKDISKVTITEDGAVARMGGAIIYIVQYVGYTIAVFVLLGIGIKYMMSSPNEKADLKARLIPYTIGAVILFGGVTVISVIYDIVTN